MSPSLSPSFSPRSVKTRNLHVQAEHSIPMQDYQIPLNHHHSHALHSGFALSRAPHVGPPQRFRTTVVSVHCGWFSVLGRVGNSADSRAHVHSGNGEVQQLEISRDALRLFGDLFIIGVFSARGVQCLAAVGGESQEEGGLPSRLPQFDVRLFLHTAGRIKPNATVPSHTNAGTSTVLPFAESTALCCCQTALYRTSILHCRYFLFSRFGLHLAEPHTSPTQKGIPVDCFAYALNCCIKSFIQCKIREEILLSSSLA